MMQIAAIPAFLVYYSFNTDLCAKEVSSRASEGIFEGVCGKKPSQQGQAIRGQQDFPPADP
eukprot:7387961-Ditylum_brightwellii.AAC.1